MLNIPPKTNETFKINIRFGRTSSIEVTAFLSTTIACSLFFSILIPY